MIEFTIIRHGQTEFNIQGKWQGHLDSPLTELGKEQVASTAKNLHSKSFDLVHCSPLGRTKQTLDVLNQHLNLNNAELSFLEILRERNVGLYSGLTFGEMELLFPDNFKERRLNPVEWRPPQGESTREFNQRAKDYLNTITQLDSKEKTLKILVVSHGGFCAQIHNQILERPLKNVFDWKVPNAGISKYLLIDKKFHCLYSDLKEKEKFLLTL